MSSDLRKPIIKMPKPYYFFLVIAIMFSCNGQKKMAAQQDKKGSDRLTLVAHDNYSGADSTETMVIKSAKALKSFYSRVNRTRKPGLPVPDIDFSKHMVLVLCSADEISDPNYGLMVLTETDAEMVLGKSEISANEQIRPSSDQASLVSPFFVYTMPLTDKRVSFKKMQ